MYLGYLSGTNWILGRSRLRRAQCRPAHRVFAMKVRQRMQKVPADARTWAATAAERRRKLSPPTRTKPYARFLETPYEMCATNAAVRCAALPCGKVGRRREKSPPSARTAPHFRLPRFFPLLPPNQEPPPSDPSSMSALTKSSPGEMCRRPPAPALARRFFAA